MARPPIPYESAIVEGGTDPISKPYYLWLYEFDQRVTQSSNVLATVALETQDAAIGTTAAWTTTTEGLYRVNVYLRITAAAGVSSSVTVTISFTESGVPLTFVLTAVTGNTTSTVQTATVFLRSDASAPISYSTAYASNPAGAMKYSLTVLVEQVA